MTVMDKLKSFFKSKEDQAPESYYEPVDDFETRDKSLKALRRLRRRQMDEMERKQLSSAIQSYNERRERDYFNDKGVMSSGGRLRSKRKITTGKLFNDDFKFMGRKKKMRGGGFL